VQPDDIEPTKVSRNWRIIIKRFSPPAAWLLTDDIVLKKSMYVSKKHMVLKKYASAQSQGRPVKRNCHLSIPNRDTGKLVISTSTDSSYVNWKEVKTDRIIQNRFSKHQSIQVNIRAQFLYRNKFKELYIISLWTTSSESDIFPA
jgi:hypothetical protein